MVSEILGKGITNATPGRQICSLLGITPRELTRAVETERRNGQPICASSDSTNPGYYLAETREEMERYCRALWHRAGEIHKTRRACQKALEQLPAEGNT